MATLEQIKELRNLTGAGVNAIKEALDKSNGDISKAVIYLREKGIAKADKRKDNVVANGVIGYYFHTNKKLMVTVEVACETDFAANSPDMVEFANALALNVAALSPRFVNVKSINQKELDSEREIYSKDLEGKSDEIRNKILEGRLSKFYEENVLLKQKLFTDESKTVEDYLNEMISKIGEKIVITRFVVVKHGGDLLVAESLD